MEETEATLIMEESEEEEENIGGGYEDLEKPTIIDYNEQEGEEKEEEEEAIGNEGKIEKKQFEGIFKESTFLRIRTMYVILNIVALILVFITAVTSLFCSIFLSNLSPAFDLFTIFYVIQIPLFVIPIIVTTPSKMEIIMHFTVPLRFLLLCIELYSIVMGIGALVFQSLMIMLACMTMLIGMANLPLFIMECMVFRWYNLISFSDENKQERDYLNLIFSVWARTISYVVTVGINVILGTMALNLIVANFLIGIIILHIIEYTSTYHWKITTKVIMNTPLRILACLLNIFLFIITTLTSDLPNIDALMVATFLEVVLFSLAILDLSFILYTSCNSMCQMLIRRKQRKALA